MLSCVLCRRSDRHHDDVPSLDHLVGVKFGQTNEGLLAVGVGAFVGKFSLVDPSVDVKVGSGGV